MTASFFIVYGLFLIETLQTALSGADLYYWFASGFGNMDHLLDPYLSSFDVPIIGSIVSGIVQYFFVYRVWVLSGRKSWWLCVIISVVSRLYSSNLCIQSRAHHTGSSLLWTPLQHLPGVYM
jgi:hypothetical protein